MKKSDSQACIAQVRQGGAYTKFIFSGAMSSSEIRLGLLFSADHTNTHTQKKPCRFYDGSAKTFGDRFFLILNRKIAVRLPEKNNFSTQVINEFP